MFERAFAQRFPKPDPVEQQFGGRFTDPAFCAYILDELAAEERKEQEMLMQQMQREINPPIPIRYEMAIDPGVMYFVSNLNEVQKIYMSAEA